MLNIFKNVIFKIGYKILVVYMLLANYKFHYPLRILSYRMKWKLPQIPKQVVHKICTIYPKELYLHNMLFHHGFGSFVKMFVIILI